MTRHTFIADNEQAPVSQIGACLETLSQVISARSTAGPESYTASLLSGPLDKPLKKLMEEAGEVALAAKDAQALTQVQAQVQAQSQTRGQAQVQTQTQTQTQGRTQAQGQGGQDASEEAYEAAIDHLRYEAADVVYHLLVILERFGISIDELAAELNMRMKDNERHKGALLLDETAIKRSL